MPEAEGTSKTIVFKDNALIEEIWFWPDEEKGRTGSVTITHKGYVDSIRGRDPPPSEESVNNSRKLYLLLAETTETGRLLVGQYAHGGPIPVGPLPFGKEVHGWGVDIKEVIDVLAAQEVLSSEEALRAYKRFGIKPNRRVKDAEPERDR